MLKRPVWFWIALLVFVVTVVILFGIEESRPFIIALFLRMLFFLKKNIVTVFAAFFLVKGKFVFNLFLKKVTLLFVTGLGKRYVVEKVLIHHFKLHFLDHIKGDIQKLVRHAKENFYNFSLGKKVIAIITFIGSLGFIAKFTGWFLAIKVFVAKIWSFLLSVFLKTGSAVAYFFTDYLWNSHIAPIIEVVLFSWILSWMERVPYLKRGLYQIYALFSSMFGWVEYSLKRLFHLPYKRFLQWLAKKLQSAIHHFIGEKHLSLFEQLKEAREVRPNAHVRLLEKRKAKRVKKKSYISAWDRVKERRKKRAQ